MNVSRTPESLLRRLYCAVSLFAFAVSIAAGAHAATAGTITGSVTSTGTRNALQGATVSIPSLNRTEHTDSAGHFVISGVPSGTVDLIVSYPGFTESRKQVTL